jgi:alkylhydroperoxidase family enzyme
LKRLLREEEGLSAAAAESCVSALLGDDFSDLSAQQRAMVTFARKLTNTPSAMHRSDTNALRRAGLSDRAILDL